MYSTKKSLRTADGAPIHDGDVVFVPGPWEAHCEKVRYAPNGILRSDYAGTVFPHGVVDPGRCYSNSDAAKQAYEAEGAG